MKIAWCKFLPAFILFQLGITKCLLAFDIPVTTYLGIEQGLSNNSVRCIYQDKKGFMWFGTYDGLNRYDGYEFKIFRNNFKNSRSLINNWINTINEDDVGNIWVGTRQGVCVYKTLSDAFSPVYYKESQTKVTKINSVIKCIERDDEGNMFIGTGSLGLFFCAKGDSVATQLILDGESNYEVFAMAKGSGKKMWVTVRGKGLFVYDYQLKKLRSLDPSMSSSCFTAKGDMLWLCTWSGLLKYNTRRRVVEKTYFKGPLSDIKSLEMGRDNKVWMATNNGIYILHPDTERFDSVVAQKQSNSLSNNIVYALLEDNESRMWIGTLRGGVNIIDPHKKRFQTIATNPAETNTLISNHIFALHENNDGNLWIGTDGGGLSVWNRQANKFTNYKHNPADPFSLCDDFITDIKTDPNNDVWIATYRNGVNRYDRATNSFEHYKFNTSDNKHSWGSPLSFVLLFDNEKKLWAGSLRRGLFLFNQQNKTFECYDSTLKDLFELVEDKNGAMWAGDLTHLIQIDKKNKRHVLYDIGNPVRSILEDKTGNLWLGTEGGGLIWFNKKQKKIVVRYTTDEGLCSNSVLNILEDDKGNLWMSTFNGLSRFDIKTKKFKNYYQSDGLQSNQFNYSAAVKLKMGELVFGGIKGFTMFRPGNVTSFNTTPPIVLTAIEAGSAPVEQQPSFINGSLSNIESIELPFDKAILSFRFAALEYSAPDKIQYAYYLQGWDRGWNYRGNIRNVIYTHLAEGSYTLRIKCTNAEGVWSEKELRLKIVVLPPWYRSWWAYIIYIAIVVAVIYYYQQYRARQTRLQYEIKIAKLNTENEKMEKERNFAELQKEKIEREKREAELALEKAEKEKSLAELSMEKATLEKERAEREREQAEHEKERVLIEKEKEINEKKISFFTNISHEFRTPLTLIINPLKDILKKKKAEQGKPENELSIVYRNARRMLSLVDQLLLFRKAESGLDKINPSRLNLHSVAREVYLCFIQQAKVKNIDYVFECNNDEFEIYADRQKMEIILYNLLSNAVKYTPDGGSIKFIVSEKEKEVEIKVQDSGAGIPKETGELLFEKFYQAERKLTSTKPGFGIGLFLVKHFTEQHKGAITYTSEEGKGATFILTLPKGKEHFGEEVIVAEHESGPVFLEAIKEEELVQNTEAPTDIEPMPDLVTEKQSILIIEDDEQIRQYLTGLFKSNYTVHQSENGEKGLELACTYLPDLVVSDIHMQGINGIELCKRIKENETLNHIPVILLTASSSDELKLKGVEGGADDYIQKPFDSQLLLARVASLLKNRNNLQKYFYNEITLNKSNLKVSPEYKEFLDKCIAVVENHLEDDDFSVKTLLSEMGMSHSNLFRKVKSISGVSVNVFIRFIRLRKAAELFVTTDYNVNETAFAVGIKDTKYFREQFNKLFKMNPSEYIKRYRGAYRNQFAVNKEWINTRDSHKRD